MRWYPRLVMAQQQIDQSYSLLVEANTRFAFRLYRAVITETEEEANSVIAPLLFSIGFSLLVNGADQQGQTEILDAAGLAGLSLSQVLEQSPALQKALAAIEKDLATDAETSERLAFANALWAVLPESFSPRFIECSRNYFACELKSSPKATVQREIAQWSAAKTQGRVTLDVDLSDFYLLLATYFKGSWNDPFPERFTANGPFNVPGSCTKMVPMMRQGGYFSYLETPEFQLLALPCSLATVYILLPAIDSSLSQARSILDEVRWRSWQRALQPRFGKVTIPRFAVSYEDEFSRVLRKVGFAHLFDSFDSLAPAVTNPDGAKLEQVIESTVVKIDEKGAEAASVLVMGLRAGGVPQMTFDFVANRPFLFLIEDNKTRSILFLGQVVEP